MTSPGASTPAASAPSSTASASALAADGARVHDTELDLAEPGAPEQLINAAAGQFGHLDILICNHARSGGDSPLGTLTAAMLDVHWAVNTRSSILLARPSRPGTTAAPAAASSS